MGEAMADPPSAPSIPSVPPPPPTESVGAVVLSYWKGAPSASMLCGYAAIFVPLMGRALVVHVQHPQTRQAQPSSRAGPPSRSVLARAPDQRSTSPPAYMAERDVALDTLSRNTPPLHAPTPAVEHPATRVWQ
jgi:hypothetical protein